MADIDRLEIKIQSDIDSVNKQLDALVKRLGIVASGLDAIRNNKGLSEFAQQARSVSATMDEITKNTQQSMSKVATEAKAAGKKVSQAFENVQKKPFEPNINVEGINSKFAELSEKFKDLGKDFTFSGSKSDLTEKLNQLSDSAEKAREQVRRLEEAGKMDTAQYETAVKDLTKLENMATNVRDELAKMIPSRSIASTFVESTNGIDERLEELGRKFREVGKDFKFTGDTKELQSEIEKTEKALDRLYAKRNRAIDLGTYDNKSFEGIIRDIEALENKLDILRSRRNDLPPLRIDTTNINEVVENTKSKISTVKEMLAKWKIILPTDGMKKIQSEIEKVRQKYAEMINYMNSKTAEDSNYANTNEFRQKQIEIEALKQKYDELIQKQNELSRVGSQGYKLNLEGVKKNLNTIVSSLQKANKAIDAFGRKLLSLLTPAKSAKSALQTFEDVIGKLGKSFLRIGTMFKTMLTRMVLRSVISGLKSGFESLAVYSDEFRVTLENLKSALATLGNSIAAAAGPLINALAPALITIINWLTTAINAVNQFISAFTGKSTWVKAQKVATGVGDAVGGAGKKAKQAAKDIMKSIRAFDELKTINLPEQNDDGGGGGGGGGAAGGEYETLPIDEKIKDAAEKAKAILKDLFKPMKEAWDKEGRFVINAWKLALHEVWTTIKTIGADFMKVWKEQETVRIFENILHIIGDVALIVSNLALNFRKAWQENDNGLKILRGIRDVFGIIIRYIRQAADATVKWSEKLNFGPLLEKIGNYIKSLEPVVDAVSGIFYDFYTKVLLPLGKWALEEGLPDLLQVFIDFNEKINWDKLRNQLAVFWDHVEPFAETVGAGLIEFIRRLSDGLANFITGDKFQDFLTNLEKWMDKQTPDTIADGIEKIITAIILLKVALLGFKAVEGIVTVFSTLKSFGTLMGTFVTGLANIPSIIAGIPGKLAVVSGAFSNAMSFLLAGLKTGLSAIATFLSTYGMTILTTLGWLAAAIAAAVAGFKIGEWISEKLGGETFDMSFLEQLEYIKDSFTDDSWKGALDEWGKDLADGWRDIGQEAKNFGKWLWDGLWEGIDTAFGPMNDWIFEHITEPFIDGVKEFFGIHSPSTVMAGIGGNLIEGLKQGIVNIWGTFSSFWVSKWESLKETVSGAWDKIKTATSSKLSSVKDTISRVWTAIKTAVSNTVSNLRSDIAQKWEAVKSDAITKFENVKQIISNAWNAIKSAISTAITAIKTTISEAWNNVKNITTTVFDAIKSAVSSAWESIKKAVTTVVTNIYTEVKAKFEAVRDKINEVITAVVGNFDAFKQSVGEAISKITDFFDKSGHEFKITLPTDPFKKFADAVKGAFDNLKKLWDDFSGKKLNVSTNSSGGKIPGEKDGGFIKDAIKGYASGGYTPRSYSLFMAGENGVPEILGTVGGKNAVAGGREITGIRDAINVNGATEAQLLSSAVSLLGIIADKDFSISQNDIGRAAQLYSRDFQKRTGKPAYTT